MILQPRTSPQRKRRSAFTLLEVLVVVAIILVLASVATVATMSYLEDARMNTTKMNLKSVETQATAAVLNNGGNVPDDLYGATARLLRGGMDEIKDGWGNQLTIEMADDPNNPGQQRVRVTANTPKGQMTSWDR